jgi:hypothetical protein
VRSLSDDDLLRRLSETVRQVRRVEAELVALIAEVDARRLYAREATPSMFAYCTEVLHLSEPEAVLRIRVARASRQHPGVLDALREGQVHLSGIALLAPLLTRRNRESLLRRATHRSKEQIRELVAELQPRPDVPSRMRKLPGRAGSGPAPGTNPLCPDTVDGVKSLSGSELPLVLGAVGSGPPQGALSAPHAAVAVEGEADVGAGVTPAPSGAVAPDPHPGSGVHVPPSPARPATIEPLSPARYKVQFTASAELREKLQRLQALMRSSVPDGDLGAIIDAAVTEKLERLEARRFGKTASPRKAVVDADTRPRSRHIPAPIRRAVHERDGGRCAYEDARGRRCAARHDLEFHHHGRPFGRGGAHRIANVRLMCRPHNQLLAERDYGKEKMARFRRGAGGASGGTEAGRGRGVAPSPPVGAAKGAGARAGPGARSVLSAGAGPPGAGGKSVIGRTPTVPGDIIDITGGSRWPSSS